ncbi:sensor histidine kinase [Planobispora takensis]|uniref:sensor histidine kinase n=1 Tax=Planobispora takensis TaxID=1367882 RepID=UPI001944B825|nr:sensor histidine kinase [Planobispora takensis]
MADSEGGVRGRWVVFLSPMVWVLLVALAAGTWVWAGSFLRSAEEEGMVQRTEVAADFIRSYMTGIAVRQREDASKALADRTVDVGRLEIFGAGLGYTSMIVLDDRGRALAIWPPRPELIGQDLTGSQPHVRVALMQDRIAVSNVFTSAVVPNQSLTAIAVPYATPHGQRIFSGGFIVADSPLGNYLREAIAPPGGYAYLVDRFGDVVATTRNPGPEVIALSRFAPQLAAALRRAPGGDYHRAGQDWYYTSAQVWPDSWKLVIVAPHRRLYAEPDEEHRRFGIVLLVSALCGLVAAAVITYIAHRRWQEQQKILRQDARLRAFHAELELFAASISHDLRTPLTAMSASAEVLVEHYPGQMSTEEAVVFVQKIRSSAARMGDLITALLAFSQLQRGQIDLQPVDMATLTDQVWAKLARHRGERDIRFERAGLPPCQGDSELLRQALATLLDNAIESTRDRPVAHIEVGYRAGPEGFTTYRVHDDGTGFDAEQLKEVFTPFQRLHRTGTYQSVGMGLSLVQRIVTRHGGHIWVESAPGGGTTFFFTLPFT